MDPKKIILIALSSLLAGMGVVFIIYKTTNKHSDSNIQFFNFRRTSIENEPEKTDEPDEINLVDLERAKEVRKEEFIKQQEEKYNSLDPNDPETKEMLEEKEVRKEEFIKQQEEKYNSLDSNDPETKAILEAKEARKAEFIKEQEAK